MRTVIVHVCGEIVPGDIVILSRRPDRGGGQSNARCDVVKGDTIESVVGRMVDEVNRHWGGPEYQARITSAGKFVIQCSDAVDAGTFLSTSEAVGLMLEVEEI